MYFVKALHLISVAYFLGFLLLDAIVLRRFFDDECHDKKLLFYEKAKTSLYFFAFLIIASGLLIIVANNFYLPTYIWLKICLAITALFGFFASPRLVKVLPRGAVHYVYAAILFLVLTCLVLAKIIN